MLLPDCHGFRVLIFSPLCPLSLPLGLKPAHTEGSQCTSHLIKEEGACLPHRRKRMNTRKLKMSVRGWRDFSSRNVCVQCMLAPHLTLPKPGKVTYSELALSVLDNVPAMGQSGHPFSQGVPSPARREGVMVIPWFLAGRLPRWP